MQIPEKTICETFEGLTTYMNNEVVGKELTKEQLDDYVQIICKAQKEICSNRNARFNDHNPFKNKFYGEIVPTKQLTDYLQGSSIIIYNDSDQKNKKIDASIMINGKRQNIEFTSVRYGYKEALELEHIREYGHVPDVDQIETNGKTKASGNRRIEKLPFWNIAEEVEGTIKEKLKNDLVSVIHEKIKKPNFLYHDAWLVVTFSTWDFMLNDEEMREVCSKITDVLAYCQFENIYFIGFTDFKNEPFFHNLEINSNPKNFIN